MDSVFKQISTLHVLCSDVCCIAEIILQSALHWTWLVRVLSGLFPACPSVCPGSECCLCCPLHLVTFSSIESFVITELIIAELSCLLQVRKLQYEYELDHVGGTRCCERNESHSYIYALCRCPNNTLN